MRQILLEISQQEFSNTYYNYAPGVYQKQLYNALTSFTDYYGNTAYYDDWEFTANTSILAVKIDKLDYIMMDSLADCIVDEQTFYYDFSTQTLYIHFINDSRQLGKEILIGATLGYSQKLSDETGNIYNSFLYDPRVSKFPNIKKNIVGNFYGRLKYSPATFGFYNPDGHFDDWRERNLFGTSGRLMYAEDPETYSDFNQIYSGYIADDNGDWESFEVDLDDERKRLEQPVATNLITLAEFPDAPEGSINKPKPVVYGKVFYRKCICIDDSATAKFLFADTLYNPVESLDGVYIDGVAQSESAVSLLDGTFELTTTDIDNVYASFTMPTKNGVSIILDLNKNYDNKNFLATYYDLVQVNRAKGGCRNTSLYVDKDTKLKDLIESVCFDCDIRYFFSDDGKIVMRLYDEDREPITTIYWDDYTDKPTRANTGTEYLTQCTIQHSKRDDKDEYMLQYVNTDYEQTAYYTYKKLKPKTFETGLYEESAAIDKSETIMKYSSNVTDVFTRSVNWNFKDLEITDFVYADPFRRVSDVENETMAIYEIIGLEKNLTNWTIKLTLRYVKPAPATWDGNLFSDGAYISTPCSDGSQSLTNNFQITE